MTIYDRICVLCKNAGISVRALEREMGFSYGAISKWRYHAPSYTKVIKVADYFGVTPDTILGAPDKRQTIQLTADDTALLLIYKELNPAGRQKVREYAADLLSSYSEE